MLPLLLGLSRGLVAGGMQTYCVATLYYGWVAGGSWNDKEIVQEIAKFEVQIND